MDATLACAQKTVQTADDVSGVARLIAKSQRAIDTEFKLAIVARHASREARKADAIDETANAITMYGSAIVEYLPHSKD